MSLNEMLVFYADVMAAHFEKNIGLNCRPDLKFYNVPLIIPALLKLHEVPAESINSLNPSQHDDKLFRHVKNDVWLTIHTSVNDLTLETKILVTVYERNELYKRYEILEVRN